MYFELKLKGESPRRAQEALLELLLGTPDGDVVYAGRIARVGGGFRQRRHGSEPRKRGAAGAAHRASARGRAGRLSLCQTGSALARFQYRACARATLRAVM